MVVTGVSGAGYRALSSEWLMALSMSVTKSPARKTSVREATALQQRGHHKVLTVQNQILTTPTKTCSEGHETDLDQQ